MSYKPGDKVWVRVELGHEQLPAGELPAVVTAGPVPAYALREQVRYPENWWQLDIEGFSDRPYRAPTSFLRPRHDPYEGDQAGSWDTTPFFNPSKKEIEHV